MTRARKKKAEATEFVGPILAEITGKPNRIELALDVSSSCVGWAQEAD